MPRKTDCRGVFGIRVLAEWQAGVGGSSRSGLVHRSLGRKRLRGEKECEPVAPKRLRGKEGGQALGVQIRLRGDKGVEP